MIISKVISGYRRTSFEVPLRKYLKSVVCLIDVKYTTLLDEDGHIWYSALILHREVKEQGNVLASAPKDEVV